MTNARRLRRALPFVLLLTGCVSWRTPSAPARAVISEERPSLVRVTRSDGRTLTIQRPVLSGDSILGLSGVDFSRLALSDIERLDVERFNATHTSALVVAQSALVVTVIAVIIEILPHY